MSEIKVIILIVWIRERFAYKNKVFANWRSIPSSYLKASRSIRNYKQLNSESKMDKEIVS